MAMIGELSVAEIEQVLRTALIGRLGIYAEGRVFIVPVAYGYDGTYVYLHSHEGLKVRLMRTHPEVCFEVEEIDSPAHWRSVVAHGTFEELTNESERDTALAAIGRQGERPAAPSMAPDVDGPTQIVVYRIRGTDRTGRYERDQVVMHPTIR